MRRFLLSLITISTPVFRNTIQASSTFRAVPVPALQYPICRRTITCANPALFQVSEVKEVEMAEPSTADAIKHMQEPASSETNILNENANTTPPSTSTTSTPATPKKEPEESKPLPKLTAAEFRAYNSMAEHMDYFHNHFRQTWTLLYTACESNTRPKNLSLRQFLQTGLQFLSHLETHHSIEEQHIFPILARKMPEFANGKNKAELLRQHAEIHVGMDGLEQYLTACRDGETELELRVLKTKMDSWGKVLWTHLDQEVKTLGAENMRRYWTVEEMRRMPM